jgi:glucose-6-phosphate isomerase
VFGWPIVEQYIAGAHNMDGHFVETNPRHNLPVLLALTDVWSDSFFLGSNNGRIICPFTEAFAAYPAFCATLESQTCGGKGVVVDGGLHHAYDRALYQSSTTTTNNNNNNNNDRVVLPSELVMTMDSQMASNVAPLFHGMDDDVHATQDALICSMFAHADELAFGSSSSSSTHDVVHNNKTGGPLLSNTTTATTTTTTSSGSEVSDGNRPSTLLICGKCDAFTCGQLVALAEHRAVVKARIWDIDPFAKEIGSSLRSKRTERLKEQLQTMFTNNAEEEEDEDDLLVQQQQGDGMNLSTKTILRHYANMTRDQRVYVVKS